MYKATVFIYIPPNSNSQPLPTTKVRENQPHPTSATILHTSHDFLSDPTDPTPPPTIVTQHTTNPQYYILPYLFITYIVIYLR